MVEKNNKIGVGFERHKNLKALSVRTCSTAGKKDPNPNQQNIVN